MVETRPLFIKKKTKTIKIEGKNEKILSSMLLSVALFAGTNHTGVVQETMSSDGYTYMKV